jgi:hypothetical protein
MTGLAGHPVHDAEQRTDGYDGKERAAELLGETAATRLSF